MTWDHYVPLAVAGGQFNEQAKRQGSTILDFAGISPHRLTGEVEAIVHNCIGSGAKYLLVNIDGSNLKLLMEPSQSIMPTPLVGEVPMWLDNEAQPLVPDSTGLLIDAGKGVVVDTSRYQEQIGDHLGRFIADALVDSTVGARGQGAYRYRFPAIFAGQRLRGRRTRPKA